MQNAINKKRLSVHFCTNSSYLVGFATAKLSLCPVDIYYSDRYAALTFGSLARSWALPSMVILPVSST